MIRRPSDKLLKDMSNDELTAESEWHFAEAERILAEVRNLRAQAVAVGDIQQAIDILEKASELEREAEAHRHQSRVVIAACRPSDPVPIQTTRASAAAKP